MESFGNAYSEAVTLYGLQMPRDEFDEVALVAWNTIGNRISRLYKIKAHTDNCNRITLPCNCDHVEAVTYADRGEEWNYVSEGEWNGDLNSRIAENYIEHKRRNTDAYYVPGGFAKYEQVGDYLYFKHPCTVNILYHGVEVDEDGLPYITEKEAHAIASYAIYTERYKQVLSLSGLSKENMQLINMLKAEWLTKCSSARVKEHISQNTMDEILNINASYNRKIFNRSFKPIR